MSETGASGGGEASIKAARAGRPEALAALYRDHGATLFRLAYRLTGTREDAEDVVHDVFVGLPEALVKYQERGRFPSWLKRVTARVALMRLRARARRREVPLAAGLPTPDLPADVESAALRAALDALPGPLRCVLVLKEIEGYSHAEVSELLGISVVASRVRLNRAVRHLRKNLGTGR